MTGIARVGDPITCGDFVAQGSPDVFVNKLPVARLGDATTGHLCYPPTTLTSTVSSTVFVNNKPVALVGKTFNVRHCCGPSCHEGVISTASPDCIVEN